MELLKSYRIRNTGRRLREAVLREKPAVWSGERRASSRQRQLAFECCESLGAKRDEEEHSIRYGARSQCSDWWWRLQLAGNRISLPPSGMLSGPFGDVLKNVTEEDS